MPESYGRKELALMLLGLPPDTPDPDERIEALLHTQAGVERHNKTAKNIYSNVSLIMRELGIDDVLDLYRKDKKGKYPAGEWIEKRKLANASKARYYSSLMSVANPERAAREIAERVPDDAREHFRERMKHYDRAVRDEMDENVADERELRSILPWEEIVSAYERNRHRLSCQQAVIADMYIGFASDPAAAPRRLDYNALRVYASRPRKPEPNYVVVRPPARARLHLSEFKTAARRAEPIDVDLPEGLSRNLAESLGRKPWRKYLLFKTRGRDRCAPLTAHLLGYHIRETTEALTGREIPVNGLRKSFITWLHSRNLSVAALKRFAYQMGHSVEMAALYRRINIEESKGAAGGAGGGGGGGAGADRCFRCGGAGHWARDCPHA